jgi:hypothetical protein
LGPNLNISIVNLKRHYNYFPDSKNRHSPLAREAIIASDRIGAEKFRRLSFASPHVGEGT